MQLKNTKDASVQVRFPKAQAKFLDHFAEAHHATLQAEVKYASFDFQTLLYSSVNEWTHL